MCFAHLLSDLLGILHLICILHVSDKGLVGALNSHLLDNTKVKYQGGSKMIKIGDKVICETGVIGIVIKQYYPTSCEQQTMIKCSDGRIYHAPTRIFKVLCRGEEE